MTTPRAFYTQLNWTANRQTLAGGIETFHGERTVGASEFPTNRRQPEPMRLRYACAIVGRQASSDFHGLIQQARII